ncbi:MAG: hypothetical protein ACYCWW_09820 [Deltaproteobacteria bacterium]
MPALAMSPSPPSGSMPQADFCAACGLPAPPMRRGSRSRTRDLRERGWLSLQSRRPRDGAPDALCNNLCPRCLEAPTPLVRLLAEAWSAGAPFPKPPHPRGSR